MDLPAVSAVPKTSDVDNTANTKYAEFDKLAAMEAEIEKLHSVIERQGINTRGDTDVFGRPFQVPVNDEHKATVFTTRMLTTCGQVIALARLTMRAG
jgi:hypothetical protein